MNRGERLEPVFTSERDRALFLHTRAEGCQKAGRQVHGFSLMSNHFGQQLSMGAAGVRRNRFSFRRR